MISPVEGTIIAVNKPAGISSFGVVRKIKFASGIKRVGHAGTLDPFAEGVLVIGIGRSATKQLGLVCDQEKEYQADVALGASTDTGDPTGQIIAEMPVPELKCSDIEAVFPQFIGATEQIPPIYSAVKIGGQRLYKLARKGIEVTRTPRPVNISKIELIGITSIGFQMHVTCSKGTYIRVLAEDIGKALGTVAHLDRLIRTRVGNYCLSEAEDLTKFTAQLQEERRRV